MRLLAILMSPKNVYALAVVLLSVIFSSDAFADLRSDNFNDNSQSSTWKKYEQNPDACWINEVNQRLEVTSNVEAFARPALYITKDYGFIPTDDFQVKIDFYNSLVSWNWNEIFIGIGFKDELDNFDEDYIYLGAGCDMNYPGFWCELIRDRQAVDSSWKTRSSNSGTFYISYDASQDRLYLSDIGYGSINAWKTFDLTPFLVPLRNGVSGVN
jgi:hypothetical protein